MIENKSDLKKYIKEDSIFYPKPVCWDLILQRPKSMIRKYLKFLRKSEYYLNVYCKRTGLKRLIGKALTIYFKYRMRKLSWKLGFQFAPNVFGPGVQITSFGTIIVNPGALIGRNCTIYPGVVIGGKSRSRREKPVDGCEAPVIGDNVYIGLGAKIIGNIKVGDFAFIAPNAVVVKDVPANSVVGGVPAKIIKVYE
jgi:serine O-acetyltransferase